MFNSVLTESNAKLYEWNFVSKVKLIKCESTGEIENYKFEGPAIIWTVGDISKAGCLLSSPPIPITFEDEQEMRRVYTLIYDVFRYKNVLTRALNDVGFFGIFPKLLETIPHVWLLFYDLYYRSFRKRETKVAPIAKQLFDKFGLSYSENALWSQRIKLAAAVARLRIQHNALTLGELLPPHLKDERVTEQAKNNPVTCWVNSIKVSDVRKLCSQIEDSFGLKMVSESHKLGRHNFKWDRHCPQIIAFHATIRSALAKSEFVKNHLLIVQDKSFCLGPATFGRIISNLELTGSVIQTHVNSPRTTAYLATLLSHNEKIKSLLAFSAGKRKGEYESYFNQLGMNNIVIFSDRLIDTPADAMYMEEVVAVFATPPNSYSAVVDPIDLVCSRGGDLSMLEVLTESGDTKEARERVASILDEQRKTLRFAMSRPQIQFVLYETHSELDAENDSMVQRAMKEINRIAKIQHATLQGKLQSPGQEATTPKEINNNENSTKLKEEEPVSVIENEQPENITDEKMLESIKVPSTDLFDTPNLPKLCLSETCNNFEKDGCYLSLLQRKQVIRLDDKYMIQMAENRGLFGSNTTASTTKSKTSKSNRKVKQEKEKPQKPKKKFKEAEGSADGSTDIPSTLNILAALNKKESQLSYSESVDIIDFGKSRDVGIAAHGQISKNILANLSSAHIRQFVSPFYKSPELNIPTSTKSQRQSDKPSKKSKDSSSSSRSSQRSGTRKQKKNKTFKNLVNRLLLPTQNVLFKSLNEEESHSKRPAIDYAKRVYHCEQCRKRNQENSRN